jgi:hypothetical protein
MGFHEIKSLNFGRVSVNFPHFMINSWAAAAMKPPSSSDTAARQKTFGGPSSWDFGNEESGLSYHLSQTLGSQRPRYDHMRHKCLDIVARR